MSTETMRRRARNRFLRGTFETLQRFRINVLPHHFYSQIPDMRKLRSTDDWRRPYGLKGIGGTEISAQLDFVRRCSEGIDTAGAQPPIYEEACRRNGAEGYGPIEAEFLYRFMSTVQPPKVIQIGAGVSTAIMLRAAEEHGFDTRITCVDPYPTDFLSELAAAGTIDLLAEPAQSLDEERLADLGPGSLLFVDSTHTVSPGSEVNRIILGVLPILPKGVFVHFHDIVFPYDYMPDLLENDLFFWSESILLQAFLTDNRRVEIRAALSMLHHGASDQLRELFSTYEPARQEDGIAIDRRNGGHYPSSAYLEVVA